MSLEAVALILGLLCAAWGVLRYAGLGYPLRVLYLAVTMSDAEVRYYNGDYAEYPEEGDDDTPDPLPPVPAPRRSVQATPIDYAALWQSGATAPAWMAQLNDEPDKAPHTAIVGPSGSGKTTLALAALHHRVGQLVICTPKAAQDDPWGGFPAARLNFSESGVSWANIEAAVQLVYAEWLRRNADGAAPRSWLTLVIDELVTTLEALPQLRQPLLNLWAMGRSVRIRVVVLGTEANVKAWGIEGRGDIRDNLLFVQCRPNRTATLGRWGEPGQQIDTSRVKELAEGDLDNERVWVPAMDSATASGAVHSAMDSAITPHSALWEARIAELTREGYSTRQIQKTLGGDYNRIVELARLAREER